ncbi:MAG: formyl transferase [Pseudomonadota bacterium]
MRIVVCTKRDLAGCLVLNQMLPRLAGHTVTVLLSDKTRPVENVVPELAEMKFFERDLPVDTLFPLVDKVGGEGARLATFAGVAARHGVAMKVVKDINGPEGEALLRDFAPDLMVSARFSLIFKRHIFDIPRLGTYNIHPGALPRYAGLFAPFRCMVEGGDSIGCTLHRVDDGIDTGPVVGIGTLPIDPARSLLWHVVNTYRPGLELFFAMLADIEAGRPVEPRPQDRSQRVYGSLPDAGSFRTFLAKGFRLFDPHEYMDIITGFLPPGMQVPHEVAAGVMGQEVGAPCCCAPA